MEYQEHNGLRLSRLGVGTYSLSGVYGSKDLEEYGRMIKRAYELGVNFFDTADAYGEAEEVLGRLLQPLRGNVIISTKVGVKHQTKANLFHEYIKTACESSLRNLRTEYIDIYNVHFDDPATPVEETIGALEELVKAGITYNIFRTIRNRKLKRETSSGKVNKPKLTKPKEVPL